MRKKEGCGGGNYVKILFNIKNKKTAEELKKEIDRLIPGDLLSTINKSYIESRNEKSNTKYNIVLPKLFIVFSRYS